MNCNFTKENAEKDEYTVLNWATTALTNPQIRLQFSCHLLILIKYPIRQTVALP
jgi:hypothetical protein